MAEPGTDAVEGDEGRRASVSPCPTGWRVPSTRRSRSGLPLGWQNIGTTQIAPIVSLPFPAKTHARAAPATEKATWRRWSLRRRNAEPELSHAGVPAVLDLVALAENEGEYEQLWSDAALAELAAPADSGAADSDVPATAGEVFASDETGNDPWSILAEEVQVRELQVEIHGLEESAPGEPAKAIGLIDNPSELADEFWVEESTMSPGWLQRRKRREDHEAEVHTT